MSPRRITRILSLLYFLFVALCAWALASPGATVPLTTTRVAQNLANPVYVTAAPSDTSRLFIVEAYSGRIKILNLQTGVVNPTPFMRQTGMLSGGEQGLLGMAFHPEYPDSPYFYVNYTRDPDNATVIRRYSRSLSSPDVADTSTGVTLVTIPKNFGGNHNAGWLGFGPNDGYLYIPLGDKSDPNYVVSQSDTTRQGKVLRIDVDGGFPYAIPPDNPFAGAPSPKNEFWAYGLRNPWRPSFDRSTGDLYIADVGQGMWEEIDYQPASSAGGENYGWAMMEGHVITPVCPPPCDTSGLTLPIYDYAHGKEPPTCSITGGYVYRGAAIPSLQGRYFFADFCSHQIWTLRVVGGVATEVTERTAELSPGGGLAIAWISSFGEDARGELYICCLYSGDIFKIIPYPTSVGPSSPADASPLSLGPGVPNPSARGFAFEIGMPERGAATLRVYDASGRLVRTVWDGVLPPGGSGLAWDGRDASGAPAAPGVYALRLESGGASRARKVVLTR